MDIVKKFQLKMVLFPIFLLLLQTAVFSQGILDKLIELQGELEANRWKMTCIETRQRQYKEPYKSEYLQLQNTKKQLGDQIRQIKMSDAYKSELLQLANQPNFSTVTECEQYKRKLQDDIKAMNDEMHAIKLKEGNTIDEKYNPAKAPLAKKYQILHEKSGYTNTKFVNCDCSKLSNNKQASPDNSNLEAEFLEEIQKINSDIEKINNYARNRELELSLVSAQALCDKIRLLQGRQYFSSALKKIRRKNPGFTFTIYPLADQLTREYWIQLRNRANISYRNALDAYSGCVYNEGIQQAGYVEIPLGFAKATYDLVTNWKDMLSGNLFGTFTALRNNSAKAVNATRNMNIIGEDIMKAGGEAADWKSYVGILGGFISAYDGYVKSYNMALENNRQGDLLVLNKQSAQQLIKRNRLLLQEFDRYRAFIDAQSSSIECLEDKLKRLDMDKKSIKGDKITIWGTGLFDWDGSEYISMIKESGEDLRNEYIYCEDFIKQLQIAVNMANTDYYAIEDKVRNSGADQSQINAQLNYNKENGEWFEKESTRLSEYYIQFCDNEGNTMPEDVTIVSTQIVPNTEEQDGDPNNPKPWEYENSDTGDDVQWDEPGNTNQQNNNNGGGSSVNGITSTGNGWSVQTTLASEESLSKDISAAVNSGRTPVGIYFGSNNDVVVYYIDGNPFGMTAWNLEWYTDAASIQSGINNMLEQGYFPMGISFSDNGLYYVLYIMSDLKVTAWQLVESEMDLGVVSKNIQPYINDNYIPVGISVLGGMYYTLMVQVQGNESVKWSIEGYEDNTLNVSQGINNMANQGLVPFGYLKEQGVVNVLFIGF